MRPGAMHRIVIDTDPGQDDAVAILLALASPEIEVLGVTTVAGNVPLPLTTRNALAVLELAGRAEVPVHAGAEAPLRRPLVTAEHVHGRTGLDGVELPEPAVAPAEGHAADFIVETLRREPPGTVTLCPLGPLTNLAMAFERDPEAASRAKGIVWMGGAYFEVGNITPAAEFNAYVDPEAAAAVLQAGYPVTILPLDATHKVLTTAGRLDGMRGLGNRAGEVAASWCGFFERFDKEKYGGAGAPLHDPCVIAQLLRPGLFAGRQINVEVETGSDLTRGMTVADWWGVTDRAPNATFVGDADAEGFWDLLLERLARLP